MRAAADAGRSAGRASLLAPGARHRRDAADALAGLALMRRRREVEVFSLSFLDCICCGFGAIILLLVLTEVSQPVELEKSRVQLQGQVRKLQAQLAVIRGETDELTRDLNSREAALAREQEKLA